MSLLQKRDPVLSLVGFLPSRRSLLARALVVSEVSLVQPCIFNVGMFLCSGHVKLVPILRIKWHVWGYILSARFVSPFLRIGLHIPPTRRLTKSDEPQQHRLWIGVSSGAASIIPTPTVDNAQFFRFGRPRRARGGFCDDAEHLHTSNYYSQDKFSS